MVDPKEISSREEFAEDKLNSYTYVTIFGNHLWAAIQQAVEEDEKLKDVMGKINVHIYVALTEIEARHIGNVHNIRCKTLDFTFQDKVYQLRKLGDRSVSNIDRMLNDMEMKLFRSLQAVSESLKLTYLRKVAGDIKSVSSLIAEIDKLKKRRKLDDIFVKLTDCSSWVQAQNLYPEHAGRIDDFFDLQMSTKYVPQRFVDFCHDAVVQDSILELSIEISIKYNGVDVKNKDLIKILKRKLENELKGSKRLCSLLVENGREVVVEPKVDDE